MSEHYVDRIHSEPAVLDIGGNVGALVLYTGAELRGREVEVSRKGASAQRVHTAIWGREINGRLVFAGIYPELPAGDYTIWRDETTPGGDVTIVAGEVAEVDWRHTA